MKRQGIALYLLITMAVSGCGAFVPVKDMDELNMKEKRALNEIQIYNEMQLQSLNFKVLEIVEGISCKNKIWDHAATKSDAIRQTRYWSMELGANGITNIQWEHPRGTTTTYNCWESITCTAEAIIVSSTPSN